MLEARGPETRTRTIMPKKRTQTFRHWAINPIDIARDYSNGERIFESYSEISSLTDGPIRPSEGAKRLGYTRKDKLDYQRVCANIEQWKNSKTPPHLIQALIKLHVIGIFRGKDGYTFDPEDKDSDSLFAPDNLENFTASNPNFEGICFIASLQFWQGSLNKLPGNFTSKKALITAPQEKELIAELLTGLGIDLHRLPGTKGFELLNYISRMLNLMGSPLGRKSQHPDVFPEYIKIALNTLKTKKNTAAEKQKAQAVIDDFVLIFIALHCHQLKNQYVGTLIGCKDQTALERQKRLFTEAVKSSSLGIVINLRDKVKRPVSSAIVKLERVTEARIERLRREFKTRINQLKGA